MSIVKVLSPDSKLLSYERIVPSQRTTNQQHEVIKRQVQVKEGNQEVKVAMDVNVLLYEDRTSFSCSSNDDGAG